MVPLRGPRSEDPLPVQLTCKANDTCFRFPRGQQRRWENVKLHEGCHYNDTFTSPSFSHVLLFVQVQRSEPTLDLEECIMWWFLKRTHSHAPPRHSIASSQWQLRRLVASHHQENSYILNKKQKKNLILAPEITAPKLPPRHQLCGEPSKYAKATG